MKRWIVVATTTSVAAVLGLSGCGSKDDTVHVVGFSVLKGANASVIPAFQATAAGRGVSFDESYDASGAQSRAVLAGAKASEVHLSLEPDMTKLVDAGIVAPSWKDGPTHGICTDSVVVFVVKKGNPDDIHTWADLVNKDVSIVTPNPASSGSAKWNLLAAYGSSLATGGTDADATAYMQQFFGQVAALPDSAKDATTAFLGGTGDVLLSYENEAIENIQGGADISYVIPDSSILIQNPCAVTTSAPKAASDFLAFQESAAGQKLYEAAGYRPLPGVGTGQVSVPGANDPSDPYPAPSVKLLTIDGDFGGWDTANDTYFGSGEDGDPLGSLTDLQNKYVK